MNDESLQRNDNFHEIIVKIDMCLKSIETQLRNVSLNNSTPSLHSENENVSISSNPPKIKLPELKISKFDAAM